MDITLFQPRQLSAAHIAAWRRMQDADQALGSPFLAPGFTRAVGALRLTARVAVISEDGEPVSFFPFERHALGAGKPIGSGFNDCQGLIHQGNLHLTADDLLQGCDLFTWDFNHLTAGQTVLSEGTRLQAPSPVVRLDNGWATYLETMRNRSPNFLRKIRAKERHLCQREGSVHAVYADDNPQLLATLIRWKTAQYHARGWRDQFARPFTATLLDNLTRAPADGCQATLSALYLSGQPIACQYSLRAEHTQALWFTAYDNRFARYSPGVLLSLKLFEAAEQHGIRLIDLGRGEDPTKNALKTGELLVGEGTVQRGRMRTTLIRGQSVAFRTLADFTAEHPVLRRAALRSARIADSFRRG